MAYEGLTDIFLSYDGDIIFENGDIKLTSGIDLIKREVFRSLITDPGDWKVYTQEGSSPGKYIGEPNTREVATGMKTFLESKLTKTVFPSNVVVRVVPVSKESVQIFITLNLLGSQLTDLSFSFDFVHGLLYTGFDAGADTLTSSNKYQVNTPSSTTSPNKYWDRIRL